MTGAAVIEEHRLAALVPEMAEDEYAALAADIAARGLLVPIVLFEGRVLDGRNRYRACLETETAPRFTEYDGTDALGFVASANLKRRHLTASQRAVLALAFEAEYAEKARERMAEGGRVSQSCETLPGGPVRAAAKAAAIVGVSARLVSDAKRLQAEAPKTLAAVRSGDYSLGEGLMRARRERNRITDAEARRVVLADVSADAQGPGWRMMAGDFRDRVAELPDGSVDAIVTDPPYTTETLELWADLAKHAARLLKRQGLLLALSGQIHLPDVMVRLGEHLSYGWVYVQLMGGANTRILSRHIIQAHKPWLAYSNGPWPSGEVNWHPDVTDPSTRAKKLFAWQQGSDPAAWLLERLTRPGDVVLDPFTGAGTYGLAALGLGREFIGVEADAGRFALAMGRLKAVRP